MTDKNRAEIAQLEMVPKKLITMSMLTANFQSTPDTLEKCQEDFKQIKKLFVSGMGSHLVCYAKLEIAEEKLVKAKKKIKSLHEKLDSYERAKMIAQMQETDSED